MKQSTVLVGKVFLFYLSVKKKNGCKLLKDEEKFMEQVLKLKGCKEVQYVNVTGAYPITFDTNLSDLSDEEIITAINNIAKNIGFTR
jgi:hypothetical protein